MLTGERRWMSARRGGMTVLGKVTVPKPVNLPSQRLENHGLDPNVEIVPKGTLSWGSRSSTAQNAWGSVASSPPNADGGAGSPSSLNDHSSSGGNGTRPSTAGSERSHERLLNVWGPSSRPSSASGVLVSNPTSIAASRPRSAETRPGSSQRSRFADPVAENSVSRVASGTMEKLGASSSKLEGFSLSSGDFPTLGSERSTEAHMRQGHISQGRPVSASGRATTPKERSAASSAEDKPVDARKEEGAVNTLKKDNAPDVGSGVPPSTDKWPREPQPCPDPSMPQHFGPWRGSAPHNTPNGVWFGGPSACPPYRSPVPPGSYPVEPFYYHHRLPARPLANLQPVPRPGPGPSGYHPNNGDSYRPHIPDSYGQHVMPVGSGVYPVQVPFDSYYGPHRVGFCSSGERDAPIIGMGVYNRYQIQNVHPDPGNFHGPGGYDPTNTAMGKEQGGSGHPHGTHQGSFRVLLKQHNGSWDESDGKEKREHAVNSHNGKGNVPGTPKKEHTANKSYHGKGNLPGTLRGDDPGENCTNDETVGFTRSASKGEASSGSPDISVHSSVPVDLSSSESESKSRRADENVVKKTETASVPAETGVIQKLLSTKRNPTLIEKIESLNNKARISDGRYDVGNATSRDEKAKQFRVLSARSGPNEGVVPRALDVTTIARDKTLEGLASEGTVGSRPVSECQASAASTLSSGAGGCTSKAPQEGVQGRADHRGKGRFNSPDVEELRKKPHIVDISSVDPLKKPESCTNDYELDNHAAQESEKFNLNIQGKAGEVYATSAFDPSNQKMQRAKMREIAAERAKQLQKEEEERIREQKARALAKLEELNRRTQAEVSNGKLDYAQPPTAATVHKQEDSPFDANTSLEVPIIPSGWNSDGDSPKTVPVGHRGSAEPSKKVPIEAPLCASLDPSITHNLSLPLPKELNASDVAVQKTTQFRDSSISKLKHVGYRKKQNMNKNDKIGNTGDPNCNADVVSNLDVSSAESNLSKEINVMGDSMVHLNKKNNRGGKNKHKFDEVSSDPSSPSLVSVREIPATASAKISKPKTQVSVLAVGSDQSVSLSENLGAQDSQAAIPSTDKRWTQPTEALVGASNQSKPQLPRRTSRSVHANRPKEKFHTDSVVWAPVRPLNKNEAADEVSHNTSIEPHASLATGHGTHSNQKRRTEMERYVPKPVAKELFQQDSTQQSPSVNQNLSSEIIRRVEMERYVPKPVTKELAQQCATRQVPSPSCNQTASDETIRRVAAENYVPNSEARELSQQQSSRQFSPSINQSASNKLTRRAESPSLIGETSEPDGEAGGKGGSSFVPKTGDSKHYKHGKTHGLWRQRGSVKASLVQPSLEGPSDQSKTVPQSIGQDQTPKAETYLPKETAPNSSISTEPVTGPVFAKDRGVRSRRKQPFKGHKGLGNNANPDPEDLHDDGILEVSQFSSLESTQLIGTVAMGENHVVDPLGSSHWQPKYQSNVSRNRQGSTAYGGKRAAYQVGKAPQKDHNSHGEDSLSQGVGSLAMINDKDNCVVLVDRSPDEKDAAKACVSVVQNIHHQEAKREKKRVESSKESAHFPDQYPDNTTKAALPENVNNKLEKSSLGLCGHGQHSRFGRGHESQRAGRNSGRQDNRKQQNQPANSDGRKHDSHFEYQPARSYNNVPNELVEEASRVTGSKYRERGRTVSRRAGENVYSREE